MITIDNRALISKSDVKDIHIVPKMANRHGLISGATGTGKTVTLQTLTETFSDLGVPVFIADVKGDLSGLAEIGGESSSVENRVTELGLYNLGFKYTSYPVRFWDVLEKQGHPIKTPIGEVDVMLLERLLGLNDTQGAILSMLFKIAEDRKLKLISLRDIRKLLIIMSRDRKKLTPIYGNMSSSSIGAIQRALMRLENDGASHFFGSPSFDLNDLMIVENNRGMVNILAADELILSPQVYTTFLLWLLTELYNRMPEVGDLEKPKLVLFFDEAHLIFRDMPKRLLNRVEQVVRLIRSKGIGVYFSTQSPSDIPQAILGQLGNRVQHTLRAYTPRDQRAVRIAAETFRANPKYDTASAITQLNTGEALVSFLDAKGAPSVVERSLVLPPQSQIGPISDTQRRAIMDSSEVNNKYECAEYDNEKEKPENTVWQKIKSALRIMCKLTSMLLLFLVVGAMVFPIWLLITLLINTKK